MKKSEMINKISQVIRTTESIHIDELSRKVLEAIEELGMLPPEIIIEHDDIHIIGLYGIETTEVHDQIANEWEQE